MPKYNLTEKKEKTPLYHTLLSKEIVDDMYLRIMEKFIAEKKYRDAKYTAKELATDLKTNARTISAVINFRYQDNYSQMVNELRVKDAMYMLKDPQFADMSMENIALEVGFSNRQCFYAAFYKRQKMTPLEYRKQNMKPLPEKEKEKKTKKVTKKTAKKRTKKSTKKVTRRRAKKD